jgi:hypothetical protein
MIAEHRRPLVAFLLVAFVCALVVGQSMREAAQRIVGGGLPLGALVRIAPDMLVTIHASGANGLGGDVPYIGRAILAVSETAPQTAAVVPVVATATAPAVSPAAAVRTVARSVAGAPARATARPHHAQSRHPVHATRAPAIARPAQSPPKLAPTRGKHVAAVRAPSVRAERTAVVQQGKRSVHATAKALHRHVVQARHATKDRPKHVVKVHHAKRHHPKPHHPKHH